jgi:serine/threonine protein kinase
MSPELCENKPYNNKSDVWALGCLCYEVSYHCVSVCVCVCKCVCVFSLSLSPSLSLTHSLSLSLSHTDDGALARIPGHELEPTGHEDNEGLFCGTRLGSVGLASAGPRHGWSHPYTLHPTPSLTLASLPKPYTLNPRLSRYVTP